MPQFFVVEWRAAPGWFVHLHNGQLGLQWGRQLRRHSCGSLEAAMAFIAELDVSVRSSAEVRIVGVLGPRQRSRMGGG